MCAHCVPILNHENRVWDIVLRFDTHYHLRDARGSSRARLPGKRQQRIDVEVPLDLRGDLVERGVDRGGVVRPIAGDADLREQRPAQRRTAQQAVDVGAQHPAVGAHRAIIAPTVQTRERPRAIGSRGRRSSGT